MRDSVALEPATGGGWLAAAGVAIWAGVCAVFAWVASLFADTPQDLWGTVAALLVAALGGGGLLKLLDWWRQSRKEKRTDEEKAADKRRKDRLADEDRNYKRLEEFCQRLREENDRLDLEISAERKENAKKFDDIMRRANRAELRAERAVVWIKYLEGRLDEAKIPYRPWAETPAGEVEMHGPNAPEPQP